MERVFAIVTTYLDNVLVIVAIRALSGKYRVYVALILFRELYVSVGGTSKIVRKNFVRNYGKRIRCMFYLFCRVLRRWFRVEKP